MLCLSAVWDENGHWGTLADLQALSEAGVLILALN